MTNFYAAYLLLCIGIVILITALFFKEQTWLYYISSAGWLFSGLFFVFNSDTMYFVLILGIFCSIAGFICALMPMILMTIGEQKAERERIANQKSYKERLSERMEKSKIKRPDYY